MVAAKVEHQNKKVNIFLLEFWMSRVYIYNLKQNTVTQHVD